MTLDTTCDRTRKTQRRPLVTGTLLALLAALWTVPAHAAVHDLRAFSGYGTILIGTCVLPNGSAGTFAMIMHPNSRDFVTGVLLGAPYLTEDHDIFTGSNSDYVIMQSRWLSGADSPLNICVLFGPAQMNGRMVQVYTEQGNDTVLAGGDAANILRVFGGAGNDYLYANSGTGIVELVGEGDNDVLWSSVPSNFDSLLGGPGDDALCRQFGDPHVSIVSGSAGFDCTNVPASITDIHSADQYHSDCQGRCLVIVN